MRCLLLLVAALVLGGCGRGMPVTLSSDEAGRVAWFVEDVCHGLPRSADELLVEGASEALLRLYAWLSGPQESGLSRALPEPLGMRRERWRQLLGPGLRRGALASGERYGLVSLQPQASPLDGRILLDPIQQENFDRQQTHEILLRIADLRPESPRGREFEQVLIRARFHLDTSAQEYEP